MARQQKQLSTFRPHLRKRKPKPLKPGTNNPTAKRRRLFIPPMTMHTDAGTTSEQARITPEENVVNRQKCIQENRKRLAELEHKKELAERSFSRREEVEKVGKLREQWLRVCQDVIKSLHAHALQEHPNMTIPELLNLLKVDPDFVCYDVENELFRADGKA